MSNGLNDIVRGYVSEQHGDKYDFRPSRKSVKDKEVYEVNLSQPFKDEAGEKGYHNVRVSVWGRAIDAVEPVVDKILAMPREQRPQIAFEGEWQESFTGNSGRVTLQFRAFDASPWFTAYKR